MQEERLTERDASSLESMFELRLLVLLHDLVTSRGPMETAELLGVNYKTLARSMEAGRLSVYLREALMEQLIARRTVEGPQSRDGGEVQQTLGGLGERVTALAGVVDELRSSIAQEMGAMREEQAGVVRGLERRLAHVEAQCQGGAGADGDAEPLVIAWRNARVADRAAKGRLERAEATERVMSLEIALMEGHGLTLAPERDPYDGIKMSSELRWRRLEVAAARRERKRALRQLWLRRVLTLGLWWE